MWEEVPDSPGVPDPLVFLAESLHLFPCHKTTTVCVCVCFMAVPRQPIHHLWAQGLGIQHVLWDIRAGGWWLESLSVKGARSLGEVKAKALGTGSWKQ